jgi:predicted HicB family RNase H-like nuclease
MSQKRATVYFDSELHQALRLKAAVMGCSISDIVNAAVTQSLVEDADDIEAFESRQAEPNIDFESVVQNLKRRGKI